MQADGAGVAPTAFVGVAPVDLTTPARDGELNKSPGAREICVIFGGKTGAHRISSLTERSMSLHDFDAKRLGQLRRRLVAYARRGLSDGHAAEDAAQEALAAMLAAPDRFRGDSALETYAIGILQHKITDMHRARGREAPCDDATIEVASERQASAAASDERPDIDAAKFWNMLRASLEQLPQRERTVFWLRDVTEWPTQAVSNYLGINDNHVHVLLHRARGKLRKDLPREFPRRISAAMAL
jgi:RNA polymerase sigma-70 factor (ECF subfamily)